MNKNKIEKQIFTYSFIFKLVLKYGNFIVTTILILYTFSFINFLDENLVLFIPLIVNLLIIYFLNKHYFNLYKILPYTIEVDDEKMICTDFFLSDKKLVIYYENISSLEGGIFDNKISGVMKVCDSRNNFCFGFYRRLNNSNMLATIILSKVKRNLYDIVLDKIKSGKKEIKK